MTDQIIIDRETILEAIDKTDAELRADYPYSSGYLCFAIVGSENHMLQFFIELARIDYDLATDLADTMRWDNLGFEKVFYFTRYRLSDPEDDIEPEGDDPAPGDYRDPGSKWNLEADMLEDQTD